jgi:coenzyme F420 hydrogenase subunit beta
MCYDYPNLLADVAVGDYYHPDMKPGALGWSVFAVRSDAGNSLVAGAVRAGHIHAEPVDPGYLKGAGYEVKLHGAVFRLLERKRHGWPVPDYHLPMDYPEPEIAKAEITPPYAKS